MTSRGQSSMPFAIVPTILGFGLLLVGMILLGTSLRPDMDATAPGRITALPAGQTLSHVTVCSIDAEFTVDGRTYTASSQDASSSNCDLEIGAPVEVDYDSDNPAKSQLHQGYIPWLGGAMAAVGLLLLAAGGVLFVLWRRKQRG